MVGAIPEAALEGIHRLGQRVPGGRLGGRDNCIGALASGDNRGLAD